MTIQEAYKFCLYCGSKANLVGEDHLECPNCGKKFFFSPSVGSACFCRNPKGEILVIERNIEPHKGTLGLPAGFVDINDPTLESTIVREIMEEVGCKVKNIKYLSSHHTIYPFAGVDRPHMSTFWVCELDEETPEPKTSSEVSKVFFADVKTLDLSKFGFDSTRMAIKDYIDFLNK